MARRRLTPATPQTGVPHAEQTPSTGFGPIETKAITRLSGVPSDPDRAPMPTSRPPIASVAAEAAGAAALEEMAESLRTARETGRLVIDLPLEAIAPDHLTRDRLPSEDAEMTALRDSLRAHGQRVPIEVTPLEGVLPYGLISGWRRLVALKALHAETGEARFATVRALLRRPDSAADAYVTMVEENELRVGLSQYERARVVARAAARGVFESEEAALRALFGGASKAKLSRIRSFVALYHGLDGVLRYPAHLPERLGLALVDALRAPDGRAHITEALTRADPADAEAERAALTRLLAPAKAPPPPPETIRPGVTLETALRGRTLTLRLRGPGVTEALAAELRALIARS
jgi:ParB family transcriptional regulator, chromosome partitioning protein